jgi:hypothetical protein
MFSRRWATDEVPGISIMFGECYSSQDWALLLQFGQRLELGRERARNHQAVVDPGGGPEVDHVEHVEPEPAEVVVHLLAQRLR